MEARDDRRLHATRPGLAWWLWFSGNAMLVQAFASRFAAQRSTWRHSAGWQREIALWNVGLCSMLVRALRKPEEPAAITLAHGLRVLSVALGLNHLVALRGKPRFVHLGGLAGNSLAIGLLSRALRAAPERR